jgi:ribosomal protein S18 acetylase RimI-like enzyme
MLTAKQLSDIEQLQKEVEAHDELELKLNWDMLRTRDSTMLDFFYYENDRLIAFIGLYPFASTVEITGMVKPGDRRRGHFTRLFEEAMTAVNGIGFKKILLNAPSGSKEAAAFLTKLGAVYSFSEHQMHWQPQPLEDAAGFTLRQSTPADLAMRVRLDVETFGIPEEDAMETESRIDGEEDTDMLMIDVNGETIGKIRVKREDGQAWIYGFSILPDHQGQGVGRNVLRHVVKQQSQLGLSVHLEVEADNARALSLYQAIGFHVVHAQDYYLYEQTI